MPNTNKAALTSAAIPPGPPPSTEGDDSEINLTPPPPPAKDEAHSVLPPQIITNPRIKIEPEFVRQTEIRKFKEKKREKLTAMIWLGKEEKKAPIPKHPISITWWPKELCFRLEKKTVVQKLFISNRSPKIMYIHCCGLWDDTARLGASWRCYPRTRILVAPGLVAEMYIRAKPRDECPVPHAYAGLQLATAHTKDTVIAYFVVPIGVIFQNYVPPPVIECEAESIETTE